MSPNEENFTCPRFKSLEDQMTIFAKKNWNDKWPLRLLAEWMLNSMAYVRDKEHWADPLPCALKAATILKRPQCVPLSICRLEYLALANENHLLDPCWLLQIFCNGIFYAWSIALDCFELHLWLLCTRTFSAHTPFVVHALQLIFDKALVMLQCWHGICKCLWPSKSALGSKGPKFHNFVTMRVSEDRCKREWRQQVASGGSDAQ